MGQSTDHKEARASVRVVYRTYDVQKDGTCPFFICITKQRQRKYVATNEKLDPKYWDDKKKAIRKSYPLHLKYELEQRLKTLVEKYERSANELVSSDVQYNSKDVALKAVEERKMMRKTTLLAYIDTLVEGMVKAKQTGNSIVYRDLRNQLAKFINDEYKIKDISFDKVTVSFCGEWENTLLATGASENTLSNRFRTLRAVLNKAIANGYMKANSYPFARNAAERHKFSVGKFDTSTRKRAIGRDKLRLIEAFIPTGSATGKWANQKNAAEVQRFTLARNVFVFSFYVGGINFVDLAKLRWGDIDNDAEGGLRVRYTRQKTGGKFNVKLLPPAIAIMEQYGPYAGSDSNGYIFPILDATKHLTETQINNRLHKILGQVNKDLKFIGERVGIKTSLTTYVARHSFGTALRKAGKSDTVIGATYQHGHDRTTKIYLDSIENETVDAAYEALL